MAAQYERTTVSPQKELEGRDCCVIQNMQARAQQLNG